jgi:hypothetical protein
MSSELKLFLTQRHEAWKTQSFFFKKYLGDFGGSAVQSYVHFPIFVLKLLLAIIQKHSPKTQDQKPNIYNSILPVGYCSRKTNYQS